MSSSAPIYVRQGEHVLAFHEDRIIAQAKTFEAAEKSAVEYLDHLKSKKDADAEAEKVAKAKFVEHPNGMKGEILGNVQGQWGEREMTVRWENGRIAKYETHGKDFKYSGEEAGSAPSALEYLEGLVHKSYAHDKESLTARKKELSGVVAKVASLIESGVSAADERHLHRLALEAEHEGTEITQAIDHLDAVDAENFATEPRDYTAVEQADLGPTTQGGNWLDETVNDMITESESQDFDKLLLEGPGQFVTDVDTAALANQGVTQELALSHIRSKTAGLVGDDIEKFRSQFLARVEQARRSELADRTAKAEKKAAKTAKTEKKAKKVPDDALFL